MLLLLACVTAPAPSATPEERLDAVRPGLAAAVKRHTDTLEPIADLVEAADGRLARMLLPAPRRETHADAHGETDGPDLWSATVRVEGDRLVGAVEGVGVEGAVLLLDLRGGPSPDLRLDLAPGGLLARKMDGWSFGEPVALPGEVFPSEGKVRFGVDLAVLPGFDPRHTGAVTAVVQDREAADFGPAGVLGPARDDAVALLVDLAAAEADPDLTVALALGFAPWRAHVAPDVVPRVHEDARAWLAYAGELDAWLARKGAGWTIEGLSAPGKLFWATPGAQAVLYGAWPAAWETGPVGAELYRHYVPDVATLRALRDGLPFAPALADAADAVDAAIWDELRYRTSDAGMEALCDQKALPLATCAAWETERGRSYGPVAGRPVPPHKAASATLQVDLWKEDGHFVGDCSIATTLGYAAYQALGIAPLGVGYAGPSWDWPTHNLPFYLAGDTFRAPQLPPSAKWDADDTWAYVVVPPLDPATGFALGWDPSGWAHGGSVAGAPMSYADVGRLHRDGIPLAEALRLVQDGWEGDWPEL